MISVLLSGLLIDLTQFLAAGFAVWYSLRFLDKSSGNKFREAYDKIKSDPFALAFYHGVRILAAAVLYGAVAG